MPPATMLAMLLFAAVLWVTPIRGSDVPVHYGGIGLARDLGYPESSSPTAFQTSTPLHILSTHINTTGLATDIACSGSGFAVALLADNRLVTWGSSSGAPARVIDLDIGPRRITKLACSRTSTLALLSDKTLLAWGGNEDGQLGLGDLQPRAIPTPVPMIDNMGTEFRARDIVASTATFIVLCETGDLVGFGHNAGAQIGDGTRISPRTTPQRVDMSSLDDAANIEIVVAVGSLGFAALTTSNNNNNNSERLVYAWGTGGTNRDLCNDQPTLRIPTRIDPGNVLQSNGKTEIDSLYAGSYAGGLAFVVRDKATQRQRAVFECRALIAPIFAFDIATLSSSSSSTNAAAKKIYQTSGSYLLVGDRDDAAKPKHVHGIPGTEGTVSIVQAADASPILFVVASHDGEVTAPVSVVTAMDAPGATNNTAPEAVPVVAVSAVPLFSNAIIIVFAVVLPVLGALFVIFRL